MVRYFFNAALLTLGAMSAHAETINFDAMAINVVPDGFSIALTGKGPAPVWSIAPAPDKAPGNVVMQSSAEDVDFRFPLLIKSDVTARDLDLSTRFRAVSGKIDQAAGLVWRYRDANNYYVVRANALEDNVVLYKVENGQRIDLPVKGKGQTYGAKAPVNKSGWNSLGVKIRGSLASVSLNGSQLYEVEDATFPNAGSIGLWTKADSVMMFDDLSWDVVK
jgi:hypothetical protein